MNASTPSSAQIAPSRGEPAKVPTPRLLSLDALRGFDMFWIIGADSLMESLNRSSPTGLTGFFAAQLDHVEWEGFRFYDLIFPLFVFIAGVSLVFSLERAIEQSGRRAAFMRIIRRSALLFALGVLYYGGFANRWPDIRLVGVLQRIALCYLFAGLIFCSLRLRGMIVVCGSLLVGYWALMTFVPVRHIHLEETHLQQLAAEFGTTNAMALFNATTNRVTGAFDKGMNLANHVDFQYLPGKKWDIYWDPEGLLSTLPAIASCLLGVFAGLLLKSRSVNDQRKVIWLIGAGVLSVTAGFLWGLQFPVIKKIWTSSYVLVAGGYSAILLGVFYQVIDLWKYQKWCQPFVWIGMNAITIYLAGNVIGFYGLGGRFAGGNVKDFLDSHITAGFGDLVVSVLGIALAIGLVRFLYCRKIFLRL